jgi:hypothetical protein
MAEQTKSADSAPFPQDPVEQLRWFAMHGVPASSDSDDRLLWAADEIERLRVFEQRAKVVLRVGTQNGGDGFYRGLESAGDYILNGADDDKEFA